jgi:hypothetical protein
MKIFSTSILLLAVALSANGQTGASTIKDSFGPNVTIVEKFNPYFLNGDFNGDGAADTLAVVKVIGTRAALPKDVRVLNPFQTNAGINISADEANPTLALAIVHGGSAGGKFLLIGESPILILQYQRAGSEDSKDLMALVRRRGKRPQGAWLPRLAKGDGVVLYTEATESMLYWNGKTYRWEESAQD